jgi:hypothetical protein
MDDNFKRIEAVLDALYKSNKKISDNLLEINSILSKMPEAIRKISRTIEATKTSGLKIRT